MNLVQNNFRSVRIAVAASFLAVASSACGLAGDSQAFSRTRASDQPDPVAAHVFDSMPTGDWLETGCNEGETGPNLPPPAYFKGVIRFGDHVMRWSSRIFDDNGCAIPRSQQGEELNVTYRSPEHFDTTDGSIALDVQIPYPGGSDATYTMYVLLKMQDGKLLFTSYPNPEARPKSMDQAAAQTFARM